MKLYGLFQGITDKDRNNLTNAFCSNYISIRDNGKQLEDNYRILYNLLYDYLEEKRVVISATSKLLWCIYPKDVILFDSFVLRAITVLMYLEPEFHGYKKIGKRPDEKESIIKYYIDYYEIVNTLYNKYTPILKEMETIKPSGPDVYRIRVWDKLLWMLGNPNELDFSKIKNPNNKI
jgi:hypothetical protein